MYWCMCIISGQGGLTRWSWGDRSDLSKLLLVESAMIKSLVVHSIATNVYVYVVSDANWNLNSEVNE